ncbi:MAG: hypothetical protein HRU03_01500 [Nanoarchaeales archaeon]|nr:hypothetical protein [Nanoarchaeales archaeon]
METKTLIDIKKMAVETLFGLDEKDFAILTEIQKYGEKTPVTLGDLTPFLINSGVSSPSRIRLRLNSLIKKNLIVTKKQKISTSEKQGQESIYWRISTKQLSILIDEETRAIRSTFGLKTIDHDVEKKAPKVKKTKSTKKPKVNKQKKPNVNKKEKSALNIMKKVNKTGFKKTTNARKNK